MTTTNSAELTAQMLPQTPRGSVSSSEGRHHYDNYIPAIALEW